MHATYEISATLGKVTFTSSDADRYPREDGEIVRRRKKIRKPERTSIIKQMIILTSRRQT